MDHGVFLTIDDTPRNAELFAGVPSMYGDNPFDAASNDLSTRVGKVSRPVSRKLLSQLFGLFVLVTLNLLKIHSKFIGTCFHSVAVEAGTVGDREVNGI